MLEVITLHREADVGRTQASDQILWGYNREIQEKHVNWVQDVCDTED